MQVNVFNCSGAGNVANMTAGELAAEYVTLASLVKRILPGTAIWGTDSSITGDIAGQCHSWYGDDLLGFNRDWLADPLQPAQYVSALTWHWYPQSSANATSGIPQMLTYEYQTRLVPYVQQMRQMADAYAPGVPLVMGETASYWAGGLANVSNRFASGFWYLQQSGYLAASGYSVQIRQDLAGAAYGLVDVTTAANGSTTYTPNPDYWTTALWKALVGTRVLDAQVAGGSDATGVWAWGFCTAARAAGSLPGDVTFVLTNFNNATVTVSLPQPAAHAGAGGSRGEYLLTPPPGAGLDSQGVLLNGAPLALLPDLSLPVFAPSIVDAATPVTLPPLAYGFYHLRGLRVPACMP